MSALCAEAIEPTPPGSFDFLAAYVVPEDAWYIIPAAVIHGKECIALYPNSPTAKYEQYREAWALLREAAELKEPASEVASKDPNPDEEPPRNRMEQRMLSSANFLRKHWER
jgi:hypothetical protein